MVRALIGDILSGKDGAVKKRSCTQLSHSCVITAHKIESAYKKKKKTAAGKAVYFKNLKRKQIYFHWRGERCEKAPGEQLCSNQLQAVLN